MNKEIVFHARSAHAVWRRQADLWATSRGGAVGRPRVSAYPEWAGTGVYLPGGGVIKRIFLLMPEEQYQDLDRQIKTNMVPGPRDKRWIETLQGQAGENCPGATDTSLSL